MHTINDNRISKELVNLCKQMGDVHLTGEL